MGNLCIIPARGGSKRIPRKNIKTFIDKPIIAYSISAAINSKLFDEVMVSTDDLEVAEIAKQFGASIPFMRSHNNSNDFASTYDVIEEVLNTYSQMGKYFDNTCCIYACAPFVTNAKLNEAFQLLIKEEFDSVFPIVPFGFPIQRALKLTNNKVQFYNPQFDLTRSQDFEKSYHDVGQFYWMNTQKVLNNKKIISQNTGSIVLSELECQDIDNEIDWQLAELKYNLLK